MTFPPINQTIENLIIYVCSWKHFLKEIAKRLFPQFNQHNILSPLFILFRHIEPTVARWILRLVTKYGFRGYVCHKCLTAEKHYVVFPIIDRFLKTYAKFNTVHNNMIHGDNLTQDHHHTLCTLTDW